jgi:dTDP-4-dehydrorhamnose reductase
MPIPTIDYPTPARRAADTRLDCSRIVGDYGIKLRPWREALAETIDRLLSNRGAP